MKKKQQIEDQNRPNYYHGKLLLEKDFLEEQSYHISARRQHTLKLHGSGVVSGLKVVFLNETSIAVQPGIAIDELGQEIFLNHAEDFYLSEEFGANDIVCVSLTYQDGAKEGVPSNDNSIKVYAVIIVAKVKEDSVGGVLLATVRLDGQGKIGPDSIDYSSTKYAGKILFPSSVGVKELAPELKTGWIRTPCNLTGLVDKDGVPLPSFLIGPTEAVSHRTETSEGKKDLGAAGAMHITIPPSVKKIIRFRIAGSKNEDKITFSLLIGGWDPKKMEHVDRVLLKEKTVSGAPFLEDYDVDNTDIDPEYSTLSLSLSCTKRAAISLIAVKVGY
jgi:hypothetical protein